MPVINLDEFSVPELRALIKDIEKEIQERQKQERKHVLLQMQQLAAEIGMTVEGVLAIETKKKTKTKGPAKYRNPDNPEQVWTGKGKRPGWVKEALERGRKLEELEIA